MAKETTTTSTKKPSETNHPSSPYDDGTSVSTNMGDEYYPATPYIVSDQCSDKDIQAGKCRNVGTNGLPHGIAYTSEGVTLNPIKLVTFTIIMLVLLRFLGKSNH